MKYDLLGVVLMKKISLIMLVIGLSILTACGTSDNDKKVEEKETEVAKKETNKESNKKAADDTAEKDQEQTNKTTEQEQTDKAEENSSADDQTTSDEENKTETEKETETTPPKAATSAISQSEFAESATLPITGGTVTTVYTGTNPQQAFFGPLNITISKYKVESVVGSDKQIDAYSPESYLGRRDGYVITLDVIIENTTNATIDYKADRMLLNGKNISNGGSKENFVPNDKMLNNSSDEFPSMSKKEGYITYMLNQEDFDKLKQSTTLTVSNPNEYNSPAIDVTEKGNITLNFPISK